MKWVWVWIFLSGGAGTLCRAAIGGALGVSERGWPVGILAVNWIGCLVAGVLLGLDVRHGWLSGETRAICFTGFLGGLTTFSAFGVDTVAMLRRGDYGLAGAYVAASLLGGFALLWGAMILFARKA